MKELDAVVIGCTDNTDTTGIQNAANSATDNGYFKYKSYSVMGIVSTNQILMIQAVARTGAHSAGTYSGGIMLSSNPAQGTEVTFNYGDATNAHGPDNNDGSCAAGGSSKWTQAYSNPVYLPAVTLSTQPVIRLGKRTATANKVCIDESWVMVEYSLIPVIGGGDEVITY